MGDLFLSTSTVSLYGFGQVCFLLICISNAWKNFIKTVNTWIIWIYWEWGQNFYSEVKWSITSWRIYSHTTCNNFMPNKIEIIVFLWCELCLFGWKFFMLFSFLPIGHLHHMEPGNKNTIPRISSSSGTFRGIRIAAPHLWAFPFHVLDYCVWKLIIILAVSSDSHPHPHVLFLSNPTFCRHLLNLHHHPKDAAKHSDTEESHHLWRLHRVQVYFTTFAGLDDLLLIAGRWPMTGMWPSATRCTTLSSWAPGSVDC